MLVLIFSSCMEGRVSTIVYWAPFLWTSSVSSKRKLVWRVRAELIWLIDPLNLWIQGTVNKLRRQKKDRIFTTNSWIIFMFFILSKRHQKHTLHCKYYVLWIVFYFVSKFLDNVAFCNASLLLFCHLNFFNLLPRNIFLGNFNCKMLRGSIHN